MNAYKTLDAVVTVVALVVSVVVRPNKGRKVRVLSDVTVHYGNKNIAGFTLPGRWTVAQADAEFRKNTAKYYNSKLPVDTTIGTVRLGPVHVARVVAEGIHSAEEIINIVASVNDKHAIYPLDGWHAAAKLGLIQQPTEQVAA